MTAVTTDWLIKFEREVAALWEAGELPFLLHLSGGNEKQLVDIFSRVCRGDWIFSTHRNHYHALLAGVPAQKLMETIQRGDSMFVFDWEHNFVSSAICAGNACIAAGVAYALKEEKSDSKVWCFVGDGAEEEGHFYEAVMMVSGYDLPCTFIIEDNDRSVDTSIKERLPNGFRMKWPDCVIRYRYTPTYPHAGNGTKKKIEFRK